METPTIGRIVIYRTDGRNGLVYDLPAIITCTLTTHPGDYPDGHSNPLPVPESLLHVHLTIFSPGGFGSVPNGAEWKGSVTFTPGSGTYVEHNVPFADLEVTPRSWRWPTRG